MKILNNELKPEHEDMVKEYLQSIANKQNNSYMLTVARDGEYPDRTIIFFQDAIQAAEAYGMYNDWGFAKEYLTVKLYEPSGKINEKIFKRNQAGDPTFLRQNYIEIAEVLNDIKDLIDKDIYESICFKIAKSFSKDNWRFNADRFLKNCCIPKSLPEYF